MLGSRVRLPMGLRMVRPPSGGQDALSTWPALAVGGTVASLVGPGFKQTMAGRARLDRPHRTDSGLRRHRSRIARCHRVRDLNKNSKWIATRATPAMSQPNFRRKDEKDMHRGHEHGNVVGQIGGQAGGASRCLITRSIHDLLASVTSRVALHCLASCPRVPAVPDHPSVR